MSEIIDLQEELETMYCYFHDNMNILKKPENIKEPKIEQIISIVESIDNIHFQYIQRFFESSSNENNYYVDELLNEEYKIEQELIKSKMEKENNTNSNDNKKEELFPISSRKGSRNKENRYSLNILKSTDKLNEELENNHAKSLYIGGHKKSLSEEQTTHEQSLIDIVKAITNSMYNSRNIIYLRDEGSNWSDLSKAVNNEDSPNKNYDDEDEDDSDNLSEYEDAFDFGVTSELNIPGKEKDNKDNKDSYKQYGTNRARSKSTSIKYENEEVSHAKDRTSISRTTTDYLNYYNINDMEDRPESEETRKELKNAFDKIINSEPHFSVCSSNKSSKNIGTIGISKAASLRRKLSNFHFVNSSSSNNQ